MAKAHPDRLCLVEGTGADGAGMTFAETWAAVGATAERLRGWGIGPDDKVAVLSPNDPRVVVTTVALLSLGAAWLPINSRESTATIVALLDRFGCDALVVHPDLAEVAEDALHSVDGLRGAVSLVDLTDTSCDIAALPPRARVADPEDRELAAVFPTGGTTGRPKGVTFTHQRLAALAECYASVLARPDDVYLAAAPLTHVGGRICLSVDRLGRHGRDPPRIRRARRARGDPAAPDHHPHRHLDDALPPPRLSRARQLRHLLVALTRVRRRADCREPDPAGDRGVRARPRRRLRADRGAHVHHPSRGRRTTSSTADPHRTSGCAAWAGRPP